MHSLDRGQAGPIPPARVGQVRLRVRSHSSPRLGKKERFLTGSGVQEGCDCRFCGFGQVARFLLLVCLNEVRQLAVGFSRVVLP